MKSFVRVQAVSPSGRGARGERVCIFVHQALASGFLPEALTNEEGIADFEIDTDAGAEISIYVSGNVKVPRGAIKANYKVFID